VGARHYGEARGAFNLPQVTEFGKHLEVASRPQPKSRRERRVTLDVLQQRLDVLADVVIARAFPEISARWL
jgi:hypothetical protein